MIGMVAFIVDVPAITDPATILLVQIYLWADSPRCAFTERTSAAIIILLIRHDWYMTILAIVLRKVWETLVILKDRSNFNYTAPLAPANPVAAGERKEFAHEISGTVGKLYLDDAATKFRCRGCQCLVAAR